jgi:hypothetical protein
MFLVVGAKVGGVQRVENEQRAPWVTHHNQNMSPGQTMDSHLLIVSRELVAPPSGPLFPS